MNITPNLDAKSSFIDAQAAPGGLRDGSQIRIGVSRKPVKRQSPNGVHWKVEHRTITLDE